MIGLQTERLVFRQWKASDYESLAEFFSDKENARYVGGEKNAEDSWRLMASYIGHYALHGYSYLAIEEKKTQKFIGTIGIWNSEPWPEPELGYWILPDFQKSGYGTEAGMAVKNYALETLKLPSLVSYIDDQNTPSKLLAIRLGADHDGAIDLLDFGPHEVYRYR